MKFAKQKKELTGVLINIEKPPASPEGEHYQELLGLTRKALKSRPENGRLERRGSRGWRFLISNGF